MNKQQMLLYFQQLADVLEKMDVKGEVCLYGGVVMCLVYNARPATKDVDAVFQPTQQMREAIQRVAEMNDLREDWLNDAVKGFLVPHSQQIFFNASHLKIYIPEPDYMLAMKTLSARVDTTDRDDVLFLIELLGIKTPQDVFSILEKYYSHHQIKPATRFFVEELFESC